MRGWAFAGFEFDLLRSELKGPRGAPIALRPKAELLLRHFLAQPGRLFAREELMDVLWPAAVVTDDSLVQCVGELRTALGDREQALIRTVPRRGYRFEAEVAPVRTEGASLPWVEPASAAAGASPSPSAVGSTGSPADAGAVPEATSFRPGRRRTAALAGLAIVVAAAAFAAWRWHAAVPLRIDEEIASRHVIAVMPLRVADGSAASLEAAGRATDQIVVQLSSRIGTRSIGRARTAPLDGAPLAQVVETLHANYVLSGRLVPAVDGRGPASVELQLVSAHDGVILGAERFELPAAPGDEAASIVGQEVMNFVRGRIGVVDDAQSTRPGHTPDAAELTLLAWNDINRRRGPAFAAQVQARFAEALRQDPSSIIALQGLGAAYLQQRVPGASLTPEQIAEGERAIERVVRLVPEDATAALLWGNLQTIRGRPDLAIPSFEKSNRLVPGFANGHLMLGRALLLVGRIDEVRPEAERAARLASLMHDTSRTSSAWTLAAEAAVMQNDDARALELARRAVAEHPVAREGHAVLAAVEALAGLPVEAAAEMAVFRRTLPSATVATYDSYRPSTNPVYLAQRARFYEGLRLAGLPER